MQERFDLAPMGAAYLDALDAGAADVADDEEQDPAEYDAWLAETLAGRYGAAALVKAGR